MLTVKQMASRVLRSRIINEEGDSGSTESGAESETAVNSMGFSSLSVTEYLKVTSTMNPTLNMDNRVASIFGCSIRSYGRPVGTPEWW